MTRINTDFRPRLPLILCILVGLAGCFTPDAHRIDAAQTPSVHSPAESSAPTPALAEFFRELYRPQTFISHDSTADNPGWLGLPVAPAPVERLRAGINSLEGCVLQHRGEAHITVITPPEAERIRAHDPSLSMDVIQAVALPMLNVARWNSPGIGSLEQDGKRTWFLVVDSPDLRALREHIARTFLLPIEVLDPDAQDLHVTIGFIGGDFWPPAGSKGPASLRPELNWQAVLGI